MSEDQEHHLSVTQSHKFKSRLQQINDKGEMPKRWQGTPIEEFIAAHNFDAKIAAGTEPKLLIVSCIEYRFQPHVPRNFAYVIRTAGGRISRIAGNEFALAYILAKGVRHIALVGHNDCGMTKVHDFKPNLVQALVEQEWEPTRAQEFIDQYAEDFAIKDEIDSLEHEFIRLKGLFKHVEVAPLFVSLSSVRLHVPAWFEDYAKQN